MGNDITHNYFKQIKDTLLRLGTCPTLVIWDEKERDKRVTKKQSRSPTNQVSPYSSFQEEEEQ
jgi:hypothetical protein